MLHRMIICISIVITSATISTMAEENKPNAEMTVAVQLYQRTYPRIERVSVYRPPGLILYPAYSDFMADIVCTGHQNIIQTISANLIAAQANADQAKTMILTRVVRLAEDGKVVDQPKPTGAVTFHVVQAADDKASVKIKVVIPSKAAQWEEGVYRLEFGIWYTDAEAKRTLAIRPIYFEVRTATKDTGDEINLLSNAVMDEIPGLSQRLLANENYARVGLAESILALDSHDVFARYALVRKAILVDAAPGDAVRMWETIQKDVGDGKAHRAESLVNPLHTLRPVPITSETLKSVIADGLRTAQEAQKLSDEAKRRVDALVVEKEYKDIVKLIATGDSASLISLENPWPALWAIRAVKQARFKAAHEILVKELLKLPQIPGLWQREIVDALAAIHDDATHGGLGTRSWVEGVTVVGWWRDHPKLDENQMPANDMLHQ